MSHKKQPLIIYESGKMKPVIRTSICTGERVAGFKDNVSGKFTEVMLIESEKDIEKFMEKYDISVAEIKKEW